MKDNILIDSNVWVYLASKQDIQKKKIAGELIDRYFDSIILSVQILGEIYTVLDKKTDLTNIEIANITSYYADSFKVIMSGKEIFKEALMIRSRYGYSFFDSLIVSTGCLSECKILYTEDLQHNQLIENKLRIINPFKEG
jgi:predicted nucleic acid-binding protein